MTLSSYEQFCESYTKQMRANIDNATGEPFRDENGNDIPNSIKLTSDTYAVPSTKLRGWYDLVEVNQRRGEQRVSLSPDHIKLLAKKV